MKRIDQQARDFFHSLNSATCVVYSTFGIDGPGGREEEECYFIIAGNLWLAICVAYNHIFYPHIP